MLAERIKFEDVTLGIRLAPEEATAAENEEGCSELAEVEEGAEK